MKMVTLVKGLFTNSHRYQLPKRDFREPATRGEVLSRRESSLVKRHLS